MADDTLTADPVRYRRIVEDAIAGRRSIRAFRPDPVDPAIVRRILEVSARAPSGTNMQPWRAYVVTGAAKQAVTDAIVNSGIRPEKAEWDEYKYYPEEFFEPYLTRRRTVGWALYNKLGIGRRDVEKMRAQHDRNFTFFDAPVGILVCIDRRLQVGSWLDLGMFIENVLIAARAHGLSTCPQAAFAPYHRQLRPILGMAEDEVLVCGVALGHEDETKPENALRTERAPLEDWVTFRE